MQLQIHYVSYWKISSIFPYRMLSGVNDYYRYFAKWNGFGNELWQHTVWTLNQLSSQSSPSLLTSNRHHCSVIFCQLKTKHTLRLIFFPCLTLVLGRVNWYVTTNMPGYVITCVLQKFWNWSRNLDSSAQKLVGCCNAGVALLHHVSVWKVRAIRDIRPRWRYSYLLYWLSGVCVKHLRGVRVAYANGGQY